MSRISASSHILLVVSPVATTRVLGFVAIVAVAVVGILPVSVPELLVRN